MVAPAQVLLCAFLFAVAALPVQAEPITVTFTAFPAAGDPVNSGSSAGFFTFDSGLIPPGGGDIQDSTFGLGAAAVHFRWGHTLFTRANADLGELRFDPSGALLGFVLGGTASPTGMGGIYSYIVAPASAVIDDILISSFAGFGGGSAITYTLEGYAGSFQGRLETSIPFVPAPVPEPSSLLLLGTGAAVLVRAGWRRRAAR